MKLLKTDTIKALLRDTMKLKTTTLSTISLGDWDKGSTFRVVFERLSPGDDEKEPPRDVLATIGVEEGDSGAVTLTMRG